MNNSYLDLQTIKDQGGFNLSTGTALDKRMLMLLENVSREVDLWCNRFFYYEIATLTFDGPGGGTLRVPDLISLSSVKEDNNLDGTFDTTWGFDDYILYPLRASPTSTSGKARPYTHLQVSDKSNGTQDEFIREQNNYQLVGTWGFQKVTSDSGLNGTLADATATSMVLTGSATGTIEPGHTCLIDDELVYVITTSGTAATVSRAINNTVGTAHTNKSVNLIRFPGAIQEAVLIQTARMWKRKDSGYADTIGLAETGQVVTWAGGLDQDVKALITPYRKVPI